MDRQMLNVVNSLLLCHLPSSRVTPPELPSGGDSASEARASSSSPATSEIHNTFYINLYRPVERYIARRIGVVMYRQVRFCYCPVEGGVGIEQYRNGLGIVCCKWRRKILSFKFTEEILV